MIAGYVHVKILPDGRVCAVMPLTFGRGRLCVNLDDTGHARGY